MLDLLACLAQVIGGDAVDRHLNNPPADVGSLDAAPRDDRPTHHS